MIDPQCISIRPYALDDIEPLYAAIMESKSHLAPWFGWCHEAYSIADTQSWVLDSIDAWKSETEYRFVIENKANIEILGAIGFNELVELHRIASLGYWVRSSALRQGVAFSAACQALRFAFNQIGLLRVEIQVLPDNSASNALALKLGAVFEGCFRNKILLRGQPREANCYSILPEDIISIAGS